MRRPVGAVLLAERAVLPLVITGLALATIGDTVR